MFNCSKYVSDKTGTVLFMRKDGKYSCSERWKSAYNLIFKTKATVEYVDVDNDFISTRVDAVADKKNHSMKLFVPASCGDDSNKLEITYSIADGITAKEVHSSGGGGGVQPDWNQNDTTAADYVKNRPCYTEVVLKEVLPETSVIMVENEYGNSVELPSFNEGLVSGTTYEVNFDGTVYSCVAGSSSYGSVFVGDEDETYPNYPFYVSYEVDGDNIYTNLYTKANGSHTISISYMAEHVVPIDNKYLANVYFTKIYYKEGKSNALYYDSSFAEEIPAKELVEIIDRGMYTLINGNTGDAKAPTNVVAYYKGNSDYAVSMNADPFISGDAIDYNVKIKITSGIA